MEYVKHETELNSTDKDGVTFRAHLEERVRKGLPAPELEEVECPEELSFLYGFALELHGRSGIGQYSLAPLSYSTIRDWSDLTGWSLEPREVDALLRIDSAMNARHKEEEKPKIDKPIEIAPWPQKKVTSG